MKNIKENGLPLNNIELLNAGIGSIDKVLTVENSLIVNATSPLLESEDGGKILVFSLKTLQKKYPLENAILKMDCEGCEYDVIIEDDIKFIEGFHEIIMEYHSETEKLVKVITKSKFVITHGDEPKKHFNWKAKMDEPWNDTR